MGGQVEQLMCTYVIFTKCTELKYMFLVSLSVFADQTVQKRNFQ